MEKIGEDFVNEKKMMKSGLNSKVVAKGVWHVLSSIWFEKWKIYTDYDSTGADVRSSEVRS